jgi:hypothetical protein
MVEGWVVSEILYFKNATDKEITVDVNGAKIGEDYIQINDDDMYRFRHVGDTIIIERENNYKDISVDVKVSIDE